MNLESFEGDSRSEQIFWRGMVLRGEEKGIVGVARAREKIREVWWRSWRSGDEFGGRGGCGWWGFDVWIWIG